MKSFHTSSTFFVMAEQESIASLASMENDSVNMDDAEVVSVSVSSSVAINSPSTDTTQEASATAVTTSEAANGEAKDKKEDGDAKDDESGEDGKKKKFKPRVLKEKTYGIYTIQQLEAANFLVEWYKGFRASAPHMIRLTKTYYSLSPSYTVVLVGVNLLKAILPSCNLWVRKEFLDQVQFAAEGKSVRRGKMVLLVGLRLLDLLVRQGLEMVTYGYPFWEVALIAIGIEWIV